MHDSIWQRGKLNKTRKNRKCNSVEVLKIKQCLHTDFVSTAKREEVFRADMNGNV